MVFYVQANVERGFITKMVKIKPITIEIEEDTWNKFKDLIPRSITLNDAVVTLIEKECKRK